MAEDKDKGTQGIVRTGRGEEQPVDKDRAQRATVTKHGPASSEGKDGEAAKKPSTSGHS